MTFGPGPALLPSASAFVAQAQGVAAQDFESARALWRKAGMLFLRAHGVGPAQHAATFRLGQVWIAKAHALCRKKNQEDAVVMWRKAAVQCEAAFVLDPQHAAAAMHAASAYACAQDPKIPRLRRPGRRLPGT